MPVRGALNASDAPTRTHPVIPDERQLRLVADLIPHIVWVASPEGDIEYFNRRAAEYTGEDTARYCRPGWDWLSLLHPGDIERVRSGWAAVTGWQEPWELDYRIRRADGRFRRHRVQGVPVHDGDGKLVKWLGTATDIEDQKALEDDLRRTEAETAANLAVLESLQAAAPVAFGLLDREFRFVRVNQTVERLSGRPAAQYLGRPAAEMFPQLWERIGEVCRRVLDTGEAVPGQEIAVIVPNDRGGARSFRVSNFPVRVSGQIIGVGFAAVDVTERRRSDVFRSVVVDNLVEGLFTIDLEGRLTTLNRAAARMLGWSSEDIVGQPHMMLFGAEDAANGHPGVLDVLAGGQPVEVADAVFVRRDGTPLPVTYSAAPMHIGGAVAGVVTIFRDMTEARQQRQREVEARHDQKLETLGRLSAGLAHEINTPIQFVGDNTRFLASAYQDMLELLLVYRECMNSGGLPWQERKALVEAAEAKADIEYLAEEVPSAVQQSLEGVDRVASLVRAMKAFSYKDSTDRAYADLNEAIRTTVTVARNEVKYVADVTLDLGDVPEVLCHAGDLNQVFLNLLVNAADAMEGRQERGRITITTRTDGPMVEIRFADDGSGIPPHLMRTVFEPFFTTKEVGKGTGQGLALARAVVCDKHGGSIDVDSTPGEGTEFILRLPIAGPGAGGAP